jgi:hypothetical protein
MFMPRWASRITLEITDIRAEKLRNITRGDAMAEGCPFQNIAKDEDPLCWYAVLWNKIHGKKHPWHQNPYVWVIDFKKVNPEI